MDRWDDLRFLAAVAQAGNMSGAARQLGANVGTVSRRIERLGEELGVTIFLKTPDGWQPNPLISGLIDATVEFQNRLTTEMNRRRLEAFDAEVPFRLMVPPLLTSKILMPGLPDLQNSAPNLQMTFVPGLCATALGEHDAIITARLPERGRLMSRRIYSIAFGLFTPSPDDIARQWVGLSSEFDETLPMRMAFDFFKCPPTYRMGSLGAVHEAMRASGLPGPLPLLLAEETNDLVAIGGKHARLRQDLWFCYHDTRRGDPAINMVAHWIDFCVDRHNRGMD